MSSLPIILTQQEQVAVSELPGENKVEQNCQQQDGGSSENYSTSFGRLKVDGTSSMYSVNFYS